MPNVLNILADNRRAGSLANSFRKKRFELFRSLVSPLAKPLNILDVGGEESFWRQMGVSADDGLRITLLNLTATPVTLPFVTSIAGDARDLSRFADGEFDIVFSNSVIEHVGDFPDQERMAREICRVGKRYFVQTPARAFPIEPHFLFPFFGVLPHAARLFLVRNFDLGWYKKIPEKKEAENFLRGFQLLNESQMTRLFVGAKLERERFLGMTKSFVCYEGFS